MGGGILHTASAEGALIHHDLCLKVFHPQKIKPKLQVSSGIVHTPHYMNTDFLRGKPVMHKANPKKHAITLTDIYWQLYAVTLELLNSCQWVYWLLLTHPISLHQRACFWVIPRHSPLPDSIPSSSPTFSSPLSEISLTTLPALTPNPTSATSLNLPLALCFSPQYKLSGPDRRANPRGRCPLVWLQTVAQPWALNRLPYDHRRSARTHRSMNPSQDRKHLTIF